MSAAPTLRPSTTNVLRVAILLTDAGRQAFLSRSLADAGHRLVSSTAADVILTDDAAVSGDGVPVILLGGYDEGQAGLLPPDALPGQIDAAVRAAGAGLTVRLAGLEALSERHTRNLLTPRENEVLTAIANGLSNKAIARHLDISLHTVKFHIESLLRKLGAHSRAEAVAKGLAHRREETIEI